jgi:V/A-type H+-transporting ATPase subunit F
MSEVIGMYKIAVLGERESVMGFAALGLAVFPVDSAEEAAEVFHRLTRQSDAYAIIYVTEALHAQIEKYASSVTPAVILIPGAGGCKGLGMNALNAAVERAVGSNIL